MPVKKLFKYELTPGKIQMPKGAQILSLGSQQDRLQAWAIVEPSKTMVDTLAVFITGQDMPPNPGKYLGTFMLENQTYVLHVFHLSQ